MGFGGNSGGGSISGASDVALNAPVNLEVLTFDSSTSKWKNGVVVTTVNYASLPAWTTLTVTKTSGTWPARPTARNDIVVQWRGPDPSPTIVSSGTGGMLDNVDIRLVTS